MNADDPIASSAGEPDEEMNGRIEQLASSI